MGRRDLKFKILLLKFYFDKGFALTNYVKYLIAFFGLASNDAYTTLLIGFGYGVSCFFIGYYWTKYHFTETENDINNKFNPFVRQMLRKKSL